MRSWQALFLFMFMVAAAPTTGQSSVGGLRAEITAVTISANRRPVVTFKVSDAKGRPIQLEDLDPDSVKFTIAVLKAGKSGEGDYQNYILTKVAGRDYVYKGELESRRSPIRYSLILIEMEHSCALNLVCWRTLSKPRSPPISTREPTT
jgi:hypothetical protein